ncbi:MAG: PilZ domain-containing protein [Candidatus Goldiibacteriota bacterium]
MGEERRNFVRLQKRHRVNYRLIVDTYANESVPANSSYTENISGSGMLMLSSKKYENGVKFEMEIEINDGDNEPIECVGEVIDSEEVSANEYNIKIKFIDIDNPVRDRLARYIIREDVKLRKK